MAKSPSIKRKFAPRPEPSIKAEIKSIVLLCLALFLGVSAAFPQLTGFVGQFLVQTAAKKIIGSGIYWLPFFLLWVGLIGFVPFLERKSIIVKRACLACFLACLVALELYGVGTSPIIDFTYAQNGGGVVGSFLLFALYKIIGIWGVAILLGVTWVLSGILIFNFSIKKLWQRWWSDQPANQYALEPVSDVQVSRSLKKSFKLFGKKEKPEPSPKDDEPSAPTDRPFKLPEFDDLDDEEEESEPEVPTARPVYTPPASLTYHNYEFPPIDLLEKYENTGSKAKQKIQQQERAKILEEALMSFQVDAKVVNITPGPSVTRYELQPGDGVKISKITALSKDIALKLAVTDVRIEAPIPGKALIGIEVPNVNVETVNMRRIIEKTDFFERKSKVVAAIGLTITGEPILMDLAKMPHVLIAGATGSGKSVCINAIILSILLRATPEEVKFLMIDPKKVELSMYEGIPHLLAPVVTDPHKAAATLKKWALSEMERRYEEFSRIGVKHIDGYNSRIEEIASLNLSSHELAKAKLDQFVNPDGQPVETFFVPQRLPYIVVIIDELADLMMVASQEVENTICRLAQMSRATGIHLVIATQRPSVDVVTGLIKANVPSRVSFFLQSQIDSRTILDMPGAEKLLGKGDMLYSPVGAPKPARVQGVYLSEKEVKNVVDFLKIQGEPAYLNEIIDIEPLESSGDSNEEQVDELFNEAKEIVKNTQYASTSYLQRKLRIGYNRAARLMDELEKKGIISQYDGEKKGRSVLS